MKNKAEMVDYLREKFNTWCDVFMWYNEEAYFTPLHGWYVKFDGPSIDQMYLENVDPRGDESGDIITDYDVFGDHS